MFLFTPGFFQNIIWRLVGTYFNGIFQFIWHGIFANIKAKTIYNPGLGAVVLLHVPIGYVYMIYSFTQSGYKFGLVIWGDLLSNSYLFLIIKGNILMKSKETNHYFSKSN